MRRPTWLAIAVVCLTVTVVKPGYSAKVMIGESDQTIAELHEFGASLFSFGTNLRSLSICLLQVI